jgi:hypothetical protein
MTVSRRRLALYAAGTTLLVLAALVLLPFLFRDRIAARMQVEASRLVAADVRWSTVGVSLIRDFPRASLRLGDLVVTGRDGFEGDTLASVAGLRVAVDLGSALRALRGTGPLVVHSVQLDRPALRMIVLEDGTANWQVFDRADPSPESNAVDFSLRRLEIRDGAVRYEDREAGLVSSAAGISHRLTGDFRKSRFSVSTRTTASSVSLRFAGVPYLGQADARVDAVVDVDTESGLVTLRDAEIRLNELLLALTGSVRQLGEAVELDLAFDSPNSAFQEILSLVPVMYRNDFAELQAAGTMSVRGTVRGRYGPGDFPALAVRDGRFQYPDLPLPARDVALDLSVRNPGGDADHTVVELKRFTVTIGTDPVEGSFVMRTPVSDPAVQAAVRGRLDLAELGRTVKLPRTDELAGALAADASVRARLSDLDAERYEQVHADGFFRATGVVVRTEGIPHAVQVDEGELRFSPRHAELTAFRGRIGSSDLEMTGRLDNLLGFALRDEELRGEARLASTFFDLDEWRSDEGEMEAVRVPRNLDLGLVADVQRLAFAGLDMRHARGSLRVRDSRATLDAFQMEIFGGSMAVTGYYETADPARPTFDVDLRLLGVDVAQAAAGAATVRALVPVARFAQGRVAADLRLHGAMGTDMTPEFEVLAGRGSFQTTGVALHGFPALERLSDLIRTEPLRHPALSDIRSTFTIQGGRLHVAAFDVRLGQFSSRVSGSHGFDDSLDYTLALQLPASAIGADATRAIGALAERAGRVGFAFQPADVITLGVQLGGSITSPSITTDLRESATSLAQQTRTALQDEADRHVDAVAERVDAALEDSRRRAEAEARRILESAERQADRIRAEAVPLSEAVRREGAEQADALLARATNPAARLAAQAGANRLRREADEKADRILREADLRADAIVLEARRQADMLAGDPIPVPD